VIVDLLISLVFGFTGTERIAVVLGASLPASLMTVVYAKENELDVQFLVSMLSIALPTSILFSFLLLALLAHVPSKSLIIGSGLTALIGMIVAVIFLVMTGKVTSQIQGHGKATPQIKPERGTSPLMRNVLIMKESISTTEPLIPPQPSQPATMFPTYKEEQGRSLN
jgi:hypothetical protein